MGLWASYLIPLYLSVVDTGMPHLDPLQASKPTAQLLEVWNAKGSEPHKTYLFQRFWEIIPLPSLSVPQGSPPQRMSDWPSMLPFPLQNSSKDPTEATFLAKPKSLPVFFLYPSGSQILVSIRTTWKNSWTAGCCPTPLSSWVRVPEWDLRICIFRYQWDHCPPHPASLPCSGSCWALPQ